MATRVASSTSISDEVFFHNSGVSLCLLVNRRARSLRVIDFRSGPNPAKRTFVMSLARREGVDRVYTLVERDECGTWARMGFAREGTIPGFYKRSDAFVLGAEVSSNDDAPVDLEQSGVRAVLSDMVDAEAERIYQHARKLLKDREGESPVVVKVQPVREADLGKAVSTAVRAGKALSGFEPFGRDVTRASYVATARGGLSLHASVELQTCFNNALIELLTSPRTPKEVSLAQATIQKLCEDLFEREVVGCFALSPVADPVLASVYVANGFRRTGVLRKHLLVGKERLDAFLWSRKLAQPTDT